MLSHDSFFLFFLLLLVTEGEEGELKKWRSDMIRLWRTENIPFPPFLFWVVAAEGGGGGEEDEDDGGEGTKVVSATTVAM
jgi:hypothetical protein